MGIFKFFSSLWRKIIWVANLIYVFVSPIYSEVIAIMKQVKEEGLKDEAARKAVFQRITDLLQSKGITVSDSVLNTLIEMIYQLVKNDRA